MSVHVWRRLLVACLPLAFASVAISSSDSSRAGPPAAPGARSTPISSALISVDRSTANGKNASASTTAPASGSSVERALTRLYQIPKPREVRRSTEAPSNASRSPAVGRRSAADARTATRGNPRPLRITADTYHTYPRTPSTKSEWVDYQRYEGIPQYYGTSPVPVYAYPQYGYPPYGIQPPADAGEAYYRFGFMERQFDRMEFHRQAEQRSKSVLTHAGTQMDRGLAAFRAGQYREAVKAFKLAGELNQGDPAARLYAAHALFAIGRYQEAVQYLRKAFSLEPRIAMLTYDLRDDYGRKDDFAQQLAELQRAAATSPADIDRQVLLGYVLNYTGRADDAYRVLVRTVRSVPGDTLAKALYEATDPPDAEVERSRKAK